MIANTGHMRELPSYDPDYLESLIDEHAAAKFLGHKVRTLQNWRVRGQGPKLIKPSANSIRYRRRDLIAWADSHQMQSTTAAP